VTDTKNMSVAHTIDSVLQTKKNDTMYDG